MICHVCVFIRISKARRDKGDTQAHLLSGAERCRICQRHHGIRYHLPQERRSSVAKEARVGIEAQQPYAVSGHSTCSTACGSRALNATAERNCWTQHLVTAGRNTW